MKPCSSVSSGYPGDGERYEEIQEEIETISRGLEIESYFNRMEAEVWLWFIEAKIFDVLLKILDKR